MKNPTGKSVNRETGVTWWDSPAVLPVVKKKNARNAYAKLSLHKEAVFCFFFWSEAEAFVRNVCLNLQHHGNNGTSLFSHFKLTHFTPVSEDKGSVLCVSGKCNATFVIAANSTWEDGPPVPRLSDKLASFHFSSDARALAGTMTVSWGMRLS